MRRRKLKHIQTMRKTKISERNDLLLMHESGAVMSLDGSYILLQEQSSDQRLMEMGLAGIPSF